MPEGLQLPRRNLIAGAGLLAMVVTVALTVSLTGNVLADPTYGGVTFALLYGLLSLHDRRHPHLLPARR